MKPPVPIEKRRALLPPRGPNRCNRCADPPKPGRRQCQVCLDAHNIRIHEKKRIERGETVPLTGEYQIAAKLLREQIKACDFDEETARRIVPDVIRSRIVTMATHSGATVREIGEAIGLPVGHIYRYLAQMKKGNAIDNRHKPAGSYAVPLTTTIGSMPRAAAALANVRTDAAPPPPPAPVMMAARPAPIEAEAPPPPPSSPSNGATMATTTTSKRKHTRKVPTDRAAKAKANGAGHAHIPAHVPPYAAPASEVARLRDFRHKIASLMACADLGVLTQDAFYAGISTALAAVSHDGN
jgi:hypothetical protein